VFKKNSLPDLAKLQIYGKTGELKRIFLSQFFNNSTTSSIIGNYNRGVVGII
jgi:hypothetical protein